jgi:hypothetical protein
MQRARTAVFFFACLGLASGVFSQEMPGRKHGLSSVAGTYRTNYNDQTSGPATYLKLEQSGKFTLTEHCFSGDAGVEGRRNGRYVISGRWINLTYGARSTTGICDNIEKIYVIEQDGNPLLFPEQRLANIATRLNTRYESLPVYPWRRDGKQLPFTADPRKWLPEPYASAIKRQTIHGSVLSVGPTTTHTILAPGMPASVLATLVLDIGARDGVYAGMFICSPGQRHFSIKAVQERESAVEWSWSQEGGTPARAGMEVTSDCLR